MSSIVWNHFDKLEKTVKCKLCSKILQYNSTSTGGMINHLKLIHPTIDYSIGKRSGECDTATASSSKNTKIEDFFTSSRPCAKARGENITTMIINMVVKDLVPINIVESQGFLSLMKFGEPNYKVPCRKTIMSRIQKVYEDKKQALIDKLTADSVDYVSITTDNWTSNKAESYITVTAHYIDSEWEMQSNVLATRYMSVAHDAANLRKAVEDITSEFGIAEKLLSCVHDNAANIDLAIRECERIQESLGCVAHTIQLCITKGFKETPTISKTIAAAGRLVAHVKRSYKATSGLVTKQTEQNLPQHKLIQSCPTRWNSVYDMFERLLEQRWPLSSLLSDRNFTKISDARTLELKDSQWLIIEEMVMVLKPLKSATTAVSKELRVSISDVGPILVALADEHLAPHVPAPIGDNADEEAQDISVRNDVAAFKLTVAAEIKRRYCSLFPLQNTEESILYKTGAVLQASYLDPRHKHMPFMPARIRQRVKSDIAINLDVRFPPDVGGRNEARAAAESNLFGSSYADEANNTRDSNDELAHYELLPKISHSDGDPLQWWKQHSTVLPRLSRMARGYLAIPATSVPSERMFSAAGRLVTKMRSNLKPRNVDMILFLNKNK